MGYKNRIAGEDLAFRIYTPLAIDLLEDQDGDGNQ